MSTSDSGITTLDATRRRRAEMDDAMLILRTGLDSPVDSPKWTAVLRAAVRQVDADLHEHIAVTEGPEGLYDEIGRGDPRLTPTVRRLCGEHTRLCKMLDELAAGLRGTPEPERLRTLARELLATLGHHKRRDTQLVYDAVALDIGGQE